MKVFCVIIPDSDCDQDWNAPLASYLSEDKANEHCARLIAEDAEDEFHLSPFYRKPFVYTIQVEE